MKWADRFRPFGSLVIWNGWTCEMVGHFYRFGHLDQLRPFGSLVI